MIKKLLACILLAITTVSASPIWAASMQGTPPIGATGERGPVGLSVLTERLNVKAYGAIGDGIADDTVSIQNALNACLLGFRPGSVFFPPGSYSTTVGLDWGDCNIIGDSPNNSVRIIWNGSARGTVFTKSTGGNGGASFGVMKGIHLRPGINEPAIWLDLRPLTTVDVHFQLQRVHFGSSSSDAIIMNGFTNLHWDDLRFDNIGGYAIHIINTNAMNLSHFSIDGFTYDHSRTTAPGEGVIHFDNADNNSNIGILELANGRIEIGSPWGGNKSIFKQTSIDVSPNPRAAQWVLRNVTFDDNSGMTGDSVLFRNTTDTTGRDTLIIENCSMSNIDEVLGGTWPANQYKPSPLSSGMNMAINTGGRNQAMDFSNHLSIANSLDNPIIDGRFQNEAATRFQVTQSGVSTWGNGSTAHDVNLKRGGVDTLQTDDAFRSNHIQITDGITAPGTTLGQSKIYVDATDGDLKVIFGDGTVKTIVVDN